LLLMPVLVLTGAPLIASTRAFAVGAYMALVPMFIGYVLFGYGLMRVTASTATTLTLAEPAIAALLAVAIVGERLAPIGWVGMAQSASLFWCSHSDQPPGRRQPTGRSRAGRSPTRHLGMGRYKDRHASPALTRTSHPKGGNPQREAAQGGARQGTWAWAGTRTGRPRVGCWAQPGLAHPGRVSATSRLSPAPLR